MNEQSVDAESGIDADDLMVRGILLMVAIKVVAIQWVGLDADAWYVWPWTWVAFGLMVPAIAEWVTECRRDWND